MKYVYIYKTLAIKNIYIYISVKIYGRFNYIFKSIKIRGKFSRAFLCENNSILRDEYPGKE